MNTGATEFHPASFRSPPGQRLTLLACSFLVIVLCAAMCYAVAITPPDGLWVNLLWAGLLAVCFALALLIVDETRATLRLRISVDPAGVHLVLPRRRGHVLLPAINEAIPLANVRAVETRQEAFSQLGMVAVQCAWRLLLSDGRSIDLGADRQFRKPLFGPAAEAIAGMAGVPVRERGMVRGSPGVLAAWKTSVPDWSAPSLPATLVEQLIARSARAFGILAAAVAVLSIIRILTRE